MILISKSTEETKLIGHDIARAILNLEKKGSSAVILKLQGDLGGGKTTFVQGLAHGLGVRQSILSPTFILMRRYGLDNAFKNLYHFDCYRLESKKDQKFLFDMEFSKITEDPQNIIIIEWSDRLNNLDLPGLEIEFIFKSEEERELIVTGFPVLEELIKLAINE